MWKLKIYLSADGRLHLGGSLRNSLNKVATSLIQKLVFRFANYQDRLGSSAKFV